MGRPFCFPEPRPIARRFNDACESGEGEELVEFTEYPLLHEADLMLTMLKVATERPASVEDGVARLKRNLQSVGEAPPVSEGEMRRHLDRATRRLVHALLLAPEGDGRFRITERGRQTLENHPGGIDDSVLMSFPEFRAHVEAEARSSHGSSPGGIDDPRIVEYDQGYAAFHDGLGLNSNPYEADRVMHLAWENGWCQARDDALQEEGWAKAVRTR
jgi:restriction system protein